MMSLKRNEELVILIVIFVIILGILIFKHVVPKRIVREPEGESSALSESIEEEKPSKIFAYITGEVKTPGVYEMKDGDRVSDLVRSAGGFTEKADESSINLAQKLEDEAQIYVSSINESKAQISGIKSSVSGGKLNINTATAEEMDSFLPGIGKTLAQNIIDYRNKNGRFKTIDELTKVDSIGNGKRFEKIKDLITVN
jgi:competence protein ComEA